ncbi:MAG: ATP-dependent DNA helicase RecQ [Bacteroidetes bacterium ADurb.Bin408]|nr:MAG: ATP-dependent DNA helicase RecQ [Bacteroidetes bacterium ADurb.Bin408]
MFILTEPIYTPSKIHIPLNKEQLYKFQVANAYYDVFLKVLLRSYSGLFDDFAKINEDELARKLGLKTEEVVKILQKLDSIDVVKYIPQKNKPQIIFSTERMAVENIRLSPENYATRKKIAETKLKAIINYATSRNKCRSQLLLEYFSDFNVKRCGTCDICLERNKIEANEIEFSRVVDKIKPILKKQEMDINDILNALPEIPKEKVTSVLRWLEDQNKIVRLNDRLFKWKI